MAVKGKMGDPVPPQMQTSLPPMGVPGEAQELVLFNRFKGNDPRNAGGPRGLPGKYTVCLLLSRPGFRPTGEREISFLHALQGDSHVQAFKPASERRADDAEILLLNAIEPTGNIVFRGQGNQHGHLGKFTTDPFDADDLYDAERKAHDALSRFLSHWSLLLDVPMHVELIETTEVRTEHKTLRILAPHLEMNLGPGGATPLLSDEYCHYVSLYKEGLNSSSNFYRYLCFFKIAEGLKERRATRDREAAKAGTPIREPALTIPATKDEMIAWLRHVYPWRDAWDEMSLEQIFPAGARGRKVAALLNGKLNTIRVGIAHAIVKTGEAQISVDNLVHQREVNSWISLLRCIARHLIHLEFPSQFVYPS